MENFEPFQTKVFSSSKVTGLDGLCYWDKLQSLRMYSQERRRERYMVIFIWKLSQGLVNGYQVQFSSTLGRRGRTAQPHTVVQSSPAMVRRAREASLGVKGARIFNLLPPDLKNLEVFLLALLKWHLTVSLQIFLD